MNPCDQKISPLPQSFKSCGTFSQIHPSRLQQLCILALLYPFSNPTSIWHQSEFLEVVNRQY